MLLQFNLNYFIRLLLPDNWSETVIEIITVLLQLLIATLIFFLVKYFIKKVFDEDFVQKISSKHLMTTKRTKTISTLLKNIATYVLYFFYIYSILTLLGFPVGTLIAGAGIAGVAIGLGAQDLINDMINGFFIIFENHFEVGDFIEVPAEEITGTVINVGIRTTTVRAASGDVFYIPNSLITTVNNKHRSQRQILIEIPLADEIDLVDFEATIQRVTDDIYATYETIMQDDPTIVGIVRGPDQTFNYRIAFAVNIGEDYMHTSKFYRHYILAFQAANIKIPSSVYDETQAQ